MVKAIHNNVVLQKENYKTSNNGIYMPKNESDCYVVLNVGPEVSTVKVGAKVVINNKPILFTDAGCDYYIVSIDNIIAVVED